MKKTFFTLLVIAFCVSCSENSVNPANGLWEYDSQGSGKPEINLEFDLNTTGSGSLKSIDFKVDSETETEVESFTVILEDHSPGQNIGRLVLTKLENNLPVKGISFYGCKSTDGKNWAVDSVMYLNENFTKFWYYDQILLKK